MRKWNGKAYYICCNGIKSVLDFHFRARKTWWNLYSAQKKIIIEIYKTIL